MGTGVLVRLIAGLGLIAAFVVGCTWAPSETPDPNALYVVRHGHSDTPPLALAEGTIERRGRCLYIGDTLMVWPESYMLEPGGTALRGDDFRIAPGDVVQVGGGGYDSLLEMPSQLIGAAPPCAGPYFWVSKTRNVVPGS
jgi:hypothetical protein